MTEIVYHRRGLSWLYYLFVVTFVLLGLLFLVVALGNAVEEVAWSEKRMGVFAYTIAGLSWLLGAPQMWAMARRYAGNEVRLDDARFRLHTAGGSEVQFAFADVQRVRWNPGLRSRLCTVETEGETYFFDTRSCPRPGQVARLVAERAGKTLVIEG